MLIMEVVRRWGVPLLAAALLILGIVLLQNVDPFVSSGPVRYATYLPDDGEPQPYFLWQPLVGSLAIVAAIVLSIGSAIVNTRRRKPDAPETPGV